ncbi:MAG: hypothetical protein JWO67_6391 [Streptosporangiaceae bacterium]|nr:hypothetical protein [Streptosporangiaceae bacterium]
MIIDRHVAVQATAKKLTLGELREFIDELDQAGAANSTVIKGRVNWGGTIKSLEATAVRFGDQEPTRR